MNDHRIRTGLTGITTAAVLIFGASLWGSQAAYAGPGMGFEPRIERMTKDLNLTAEQQTAIRDIMDNNRKQREQLMQDMRRQIDAVLTEAQKSKRDEMQQTQMQRRLDRMTKQLDLSDDQVTKIKSVFEEQRTNPALTPAEARDQIAAILTDEQRAEFQERAPHHPRPERTGPSEQPDAGNQY